MKLGTLGGRGSGMSVKISNSGPGRGHGSQEHENSCEIRKKRPQDLGCIPSPQTFDQRPFSRASGQSRADFPGTGENDQVTGYQMIKPEAIFKLEQEEPWILGEEILSQNFPDKNFRVSVQGFFLVPLVFSF
eukprot:bmy_14783T0